MMSALAADMRVMMVAKASWISTGAGLEGRILSWARRTPTPTTRPAVMIEAWIIERVLIRIISFRTRAMLRQRARPGWFGPGFPFWPPGPAAIIYPIAPMRAGCLILQFRACSGVRGTRASLPRQQRPAPDPCRETPLLPVRRSSALKKAPISSAWPRKYCASRADEEIWGGSERRNRSEQPLGQIGDAAGQIAESREGTAPARPEESRGASESRSWGFMTRQATFDRTTLSGNIGLFPSGR